MLQRTGKFSTPMALYLFIGIVGLLFPHISSFASEEHPGTSSPDKAQPAPVDASPPSGQLPTSTAQSSYDKKGQQELEALRKKPEEFRTLITGVQIFLGRFGYGVGPYTGILDQSTKKALQAYQEQAGLSQTGDIDFPTLKRLTEDDRLMNRVVPFLPQQAFRDQEWDQWLEAQGSWMLNEGNTDDILQTSRVTCLRTLKRCIDSTAFLVNANVPQMKVHTHVYDVKEWDDLKIVSEPYEGEACAVSILRISRNPPLVTRFVSLQGNAGECGNVKTEDRHYTLEDGQKIYQILKMQKADAIQQILQVVK